MEESVCVCAFVLCLRIFHNILMYSLFYVTLINKDVSKKKNKKNPDPKKYLINKIKIVLKDQRSLDLFTFMDKEEY